MSLVKFKERFRRMFVSTVSILIVVAAVAVLLCTLFLPVIQVSGDSMEPQFVNGQTVWVHAQKELDDGEIGIFFHNGEGFIKKLGYKDGKIFLISLNHRKYEPREIKEGDVFFVFGKVVG